MKLTIKRFESINYDLKIYQTIDGRIFVRDHPDIDIVIIPEKNKIVTFPKREMNEYIYGSQDILFDFLVKRGLIPPDTIQGGSIYYSLEASIAISKSDINAIDMVLMNIAEFLEQEKEYFKAEEDYHKEVNQRYSSPDEDETTELGKVPHKEFKGAIPRKHRPHNYGGSFGASF